MKMEKKIKKTIWLLGVKIEALADVDDMVEDAPPLKNQGQGASSSSSRVVIPPRHRWLDFLPGARFVAKKTLEESDVATVQSRFLIPTSREILELWNSLVRNMMLNEKNSIRVKVMDCTRRCYAMDFKKWPSLNKFVLNKGWMKLVKANQLKKGAVVELWCYRRDSRLIFALDIISRANY